MPHAVHLRRHPYSSLVRAWLVVALLLPLATKAAPPDIPGAERFCGEEDDHKPARMCVLQQQRGDEVRFWVSNEYPFPVSVRFRPRFVNMAPDIAFPLTRTFPPHSLTEVYHARRVNSAATFSWRNDWNWSMGPSSATHDPNLCYRKPFPEASEFPVTQGPHGTFSHRGAFAEAIDWAMPTGTPVLAAREGMVIFVRDRYRGRSLDRSFMARTNTITMLHEDGTMAEYSHIDTGSARVKQGQRVAAGDLLALSGDVGYSGSEHLHFRVFRLDETLEEESLPIRFQSPVD